MLDLSYNNLVGEMPEAFAAMGSLRELLMDVNRLTGPLPGNHPHSLVSCRVRSRPHYFCDLVVPQKGFLFTTNNAAACGPNLYQSRGVSVTDGITRGGAEVTVIPPEGNTPTYTPHSLI